MPIDLAAFGAGGRLEIALAFHKKSVHVTL